MNNTRTSAVGLTLAIAGFLSPAAADEPCLETWTEGVFANRTYELEVNDVIGFDAGAGAGAMLYIAGRFAGLGDTQSANVICFDGTDWYPLGDGLNKEVHDLLVFDDGAGPTIYAAGAFTGSGQTALSYVARWDGEQWRPVGLPTIGDRIVALAAHDAGQGAALYAISVDNQGSGDDAWRLLRFAGAQWEIVVEEAEGAARALCSWDDGAGPALYVGGSFAEIGGVAAEGIACYRDGGWTALGEGLFAQGHNASVTDLLPFDDGAGEALFVGGNFDAAGSTNAWNIAKWTGAQWLSVGDWTHDGAQLPLLDFVGYDPGDGDRLYIAAQHRDGVAVWDGTVSSVIGEDAIRGNAWEVGAAVLEGEALLIAFDDEGFVFWDGVNWRVDPPLARGGHAAAARVTAALGAWERLYAAGLLGGPTDDRRFVAAWNGVEWEDLPGLFDSGSYDLFLNPLRDIAVFDDGAGPALYVTGSPWNDDLVAGGIGRWNGASWQALGAGLSHPYVRAGNSLAVYDGGDGSAVFVGGSFTMAGGSPANNIASWDGAAWQALGDGLNDVVTGLAAADVGAGERLYAIGEFRLADYTTIVNYIAAWDGRSWHDLEGGIDAPPAGLAAFEEDGHLALYVLGEFTSAGGRVSNGFAKWDGQHWRPAGPNPEGEAAGLFTLAAPAGAQLYAFTRAPDGSLWIGRAWRWLGDHWFCIGEFRYPGEPVDMAVFDDSAGPALFVGGDFGEVDGIHSRGIARRNLCDPDDIAADLNGDGVIDQADLGLLLAAYDTCAGDAFYDERADLTGDACVDHTDLGALLQAYPN
ncbi:MAG: hypothetical protein ACF8NJ_02610 [Phycisphaerales bacterium JB038]